MRRKTMICISEWMNLFIGRMKETFPDRIIFLGLQGSYGRGEAKESSDIDVVVILDQLTYSDLCLYRDAVKDLPAREKLCGFVSGREELSHWEKSDLFQFYYDTKAVIGSLDEIIPPITEEDVVRAIKIGAGNLYHMACHNAIHDRSAEILEALYKSAFFTMQAKHFYYTGTYLSQKQALIPFLSSVE